MIEEIAVTGIGLITPHGHVASDVFERLLSGQSAIDRWPETAGLSPLVAAPIAFDEKPWFTRLQLAGVDRVSQMAVAAAELAVNDAQSPPTEPERCGVYVGTGMGGAQAIEAAFDTYARSGRVPPLTVPASMANAPAAHIAMRRKVQGPVMTYSIACSSSAIAIAEAAKALRCGEIDMAIAGGAEALLVPSVLRAWQALQTLARPREDDAASSCRPFSADRTGLVLGEGAAFMVLERADDAKARGAPIRALLAGHGVSCDASHLTKPDASGQVLALRSALRAAGISAADVGYCNAHGTATLVGDVVECEALSAVWQDDLPKLRVSSTKSMHGHLLGAAGALEAAITVLGLQRGAFPATAFLDDPDPKCAIPHVRRDEDRSAVRYAISNSFAFGGTNAVLLFRRHD